MIAFFKKLLFKPKDPEAVDWQMVRRYIKTHTRFDCANRDIPRWGSFEDARRLYDDLQLIRERSNLATNQAINRAFNLPENFMLCRPLDRETILTMGR